MELILIRHAQSVYNTGVTLNLDTELTDLGKEQIESTASFLKDNFDLSQFQAISSPYLRTLQTSDIIHKTTNLKFKVSGGVREYHIDKTNPELQDGGLRLPNRAKEFSHCNWVSEEWGDLGNFYSNETLEDFITRMELFYKSLRQGKYLIVSHGAPIKILYEIGIGNNKKDLVDRYSKEPNEMSMRLSEDTYKIIHNSSITWVSEGECKWYSKVDHLKSS